MPLPTKQPVTRIQDGDLVHPTFINAPINDLEQNIDNIRSYLEASALGDFDFIAEKSSGLSFVYTSGSVKVNNQIVDVPEGTISLTAETTNYLEFDPVSNTVRKVSNGFTAGAVPLWQVVTNSTDIVSMIDRRTLLDSTRSVDVHHEPTNGIQSTNVKDAINELAGTKVNRSGDTITGHLTVQNNITADGVISNSVDSKVVSGKNQAGDKIGVGGNDDTDNEVWVHSSVNRIDFVNRLLDVFVDIRAGKGFFNGNVDMRGNSIVNVKSPVNPTDAANKEYVDTFKGDAFVFGQNVTKMVFASFPLPPGWTLDTTVSDRTILLTNNTSEVGKTSGSWTITGMNSAGGHNHGGTVGSPTSNALRGTSENTAPQVSTNAHRHSISTDGAHIHTFNGTWRPYHIKMVVGVRNPK